MDADPSADGLGWVESAYRNLAPEVMRYAMAAWRMVMAISPVISPRKPSSDSTNPRLPPLTITERRARAVISSTGCSTWFGSYP